MKSRICEMIGIEYPIIQGGMAWVANPALTSAVSNADGLGIVACGHALAISLKDSSKRWNV